MYINMHYHCVRKTICMKLLPTKSLRTRSLIFYKYIDLISIYIYNIICNFIYYNNIYYILLISIYNIIILIYLISSLYIF